MPISMFNASVPVFIRGLTVLSSLLDKAEQHAKALSLAEAALVEARLAPDMLTLAGQVQRASDTAKLGTARLTGTEAPSYEDKESRFNELQERCAKTIAYLQTVQADAFEGSETRPVTFGGTPKWTLPGEDYLLRFALPNFFFHVTTAHDILRHKGVTIGKRDYLGPYEETAS